MKRNIKIIVLLSIISAFSIISCKKMDDKYRQFIENGETIYVAKADSMKVSGGRNRIELSWLLLSDPKVRSYKVYWNNRRDSIENPVQKTENVDTIRVMLNNMDEGIYHFEIFMYDKDHNSSVNSKIAGTVYGSNYQESLLTRTFRSMRRLTSDIEIDWMSAEESLVRAEVKYKDRNGNIVNHLVNNEAELDTLTSFPANGSFEYRSVFLPDTSALDTFYTEYTTLKTEDRVLNGMNLSFTTTVQYGNQENQFSVLASTDFTGIYDSDAINAATWIDITSDYPLATGTSQVTWGSKDLSDLFVKNKPIYIAFRYRTLPQDENGNQRSWTVRKFSILNNSDDVIADHEDADFQMVHIGPVQPGRNSISSSSIVMRGNNTEDKEVLTETWAISKAFD